MPSSVLVVCFDLPPLSYFQEGLESDTYSRKSIYEFYTTLIRLAKVFPNFYFVVKPKNTDIFYSSFYSEIRNDLNDLTNFEILNDLKKYNPYNLAYYADIIIGKHTSILEEAFSAGKKIIIYDSEKYIQSTDHVLNEIDIIEDTYEGLSKRIIEITENGKYLDQDEWATFKNNYFSPQSGINGFEQIRNNVKIIYDEL